MKAHRRYARIAPKKMNLVAAMVRNLPVREAATVLEHTPKKAARILERVLKSAVANAEHNARQKADDLYIRTLIVNQGSSLRRHIYRARGMVRPIRKFTSHVSVELGVRVPDEKKSRKPKSTTIPKKDSSVSSKSLPAGRQGSTSSHSSFSSSSWARK